MRATRILHLATLAAVLATGVPAAAQRGNAINIPFERMTLPNGLEVILAPDRTAPQVAVNVYYHVGSKNEVPRTSRACRAAFPSPTTKCSRARSR